MSAVSVVEGMANVVKVVGDFLARNTVRIPALVLLAIEGAEVFDIATLSPDQQDWAVRAVAGFLLFVTGGTVTANSKINGGKAWGGLTGKTPTTTEDV